VKNEKIGLSIWPLWTAMAIQDVKNRYRRSVLGPFWITITMGITILCMGPLYGGLFGGQDPLFIPRMAFGLIVWALISSSFLDYTECYTSSSHYIKNIRLPYTIYIYRITVKQLIIFTHNLFLLIPIYFIYPSILNLNIFYIFISLIFLILLLVALGTLISIFCTRYRDLSPLVNNLIQLLFFVTPIVWPLSQLSNKRQIIVKLNPGYYMLELVRMPLMGQIPDKSIIFTSVCILIIVGIFALYVHRKYSSRIAYWL